MVQIVARVGFVDLPLTVDPPYDNACNSLGGGRSCPVHSGENHSWELRFMIDDRIPIAPSMDVRIQAGEGNRVTACGMVTARVLPL